MVPWFRLPPCNEAGGGTLPYQHKSPEKSLRKITEVFVLICRNERIVQLTGASSGRGGFGPPLYFFALLLPDGKERACCEHGDNQASDMDKEEADRAPFPNDPRKMCGDDKSKPCLKRNAGAIGGGMRL